MIATSILDSLKSPGLLLTGPLLKVAILSKNKQFQKKSQKFKNRPSKQSIQQFNKKLETKKKHKSPQIWPKVKEVKK